MKPIAFILATMLCQVAMAGSFFQVEFTASPRDAVDGYPFLDAAVQATYTEPDAWPQASQLARQSGLLVAMKR